MGQWFSHLGGPSTIGGLNIVSGPSAGLTESGYILQGLDIPVGQCRPATRRERMGML